MVLSSPWQLFQVLKAIFNASVSGGGWVEYSLDIKGWQLPSEEVTSPHLGPLSWESLLKAYASLRDGDSMSEDP